MNIHREGPLANSISLYLSHKRALGKRMEKPESVLRLLDKYFVEQKVEDLNQISQVHLEGFLRSRPRTSWAQLQRATRRSASTFRLAGEPGKTCDLPFTMFTTPSVAGAPTIPLQPGPSSAPFRPRPTTAPPSAGSRSRRNLSDDLRTSLWFGLARGRSVPIAATGR